MVVDFRLFVFTLQVRYFHPLPFGTPPVSGGESVTTENTAQADCPPETGVTRSEATEGVDVFLIVLVYFFILVLVCVKPLRSLSCVASDYSSDSVVCIGFLRPLRPLREIKDNSVFVLHADYAKSAEFISMCFTLALEWS